MPWLFYHLSRLRGAAAFHPRGVAFRATWLPEPQDGVLAGSRLMGEPTAAVIRLSHGVGLPASYPDILGLAIRILDVHGPGQDQDLLLASVAPMRRGRHVLRPARDYAQVTFSTVLPYDVAGRRAPLAARVGPTANTATYAEIQSGGPNAVPLFNLYLGTTAGPRLGRLVTTGGLSSHLADTLRFDPWNTGLELRPAGRLNRLRQPTYAASQHGRGAPEVETRAHVRNRATHAHERPQPNAASSSRRAPAD